MLMAEEGASVVVNDLGGNVDGTGAATGPADEVVAEIRAAGGTAVASRDTVAAFEGARNIVRTAIDNFGRMDILCHVAGILRDRMVFNMTEEEWDGVLAVHLKGAFNTVHNAIPYMIQQRYGRVCLFSSGSGLGNTGQANYSAAKGGILSLTIVQAAELGRYGVTANALAPQARTGMTEEVFADMMQIPSDGSFDRYDPANVAPLVVWLASEASGHVTGRCFEIFGGKLSIADGWRPGQVHDKGARFDAQELGSIVSALLDDTPAAEPVYGA